jgi:hypothetical protein
LGLAARDGLVWGPFGSLGGRWASGRSVPRERAAEKARRRLKTWEALNGIFTNLDKTIYVILICRFMSVSGARKTLNQFWPREKEKKEVFRGNLKTSEERKKMPKKSSLF